MNKLLALILATLSVSSFADYRNVEKGVILDKYTTFVREGTLSECVQQTQTFYNNNQGTHWSHEFVDSAGAVSMLFLTPKNMYAVICIYRTPNTTTMMINKK